MNIFTRDNWEEMMAELQNPVLTVEYIETRLIALRATFDKLVEHLNPDDFDTLKALGNLSTQIAMIRHLLLTIAKEGFHPYAHLQ